MSTIKISELPKFSSINANTSNTLFVGVDIPSAQTFQFSAGTLAAGLFANTELVVGNNRIFYDNTVAQFSGVANNYLQINFQNFSTGTKASSDFVVSTDDSDNITKFVDLGISNGNYSDPVNYSAFSGYDAYLYNYGPTISGARGNLIIGAASANAKTIFIAGGVMQQNIVAWMTTTGLKLNTQSYITFSDNTIQTTAAASNAYSQAAFALANTTVTNQAAINTTQNTSITSAFTAANSAGSYANSSFTAANSAGSYANSSFTKANTMLANTSGAIFGGNLNIAGNVTMIGIAATGQFNPQKGLIYTPRVLSGAQTAITIDFANDSIIRATLTADLTVTLSNYVTGKMVEIWLTNTGGATRTITHGCSATNSSENATTFSIPATSSAYIRYFSIGGDLANTFVTSTHA